MSIHRMARNTPHVPKSVTIYSITIPPFNHGTIGEQGGSSSGKNEVMAICKCGAKFGDGKVRQCKGCGHQWPCIRQSKKTGDNQQKRRYSDMLQAVPYLRNGKGKYIKIGELIVYKRHEKQTLKNLL